MLSGYLYVAQRVSAAVLAPLVVVHLGLIVYAIQDGLSAAEVLARTRGSTYWGIHYSVFVVMAAIHGAIGMRTIAAEFIGWRGLALNLAALLFGFLLIALGARAVAAVVL